MDPRISLPSCRRALLTAGLALAACLAAPAAGQESPGGNWSFTVAPFAWLPGISGSGQIVGAERSFDVDFGELIQRTDIAAFAHARVRYRRLSLELDALWVRIEERPDTGLEQLEVDVDQVIFTPALAYRLVDTRVSASDRPGHVAGVSVNARVGARWFATEVVGIQNGELVELNRGLATSRWEPLVGARLRWHFAPRWSLAARADLGGFGLGDAADLTLEGEALVGYELSRRFSAFGGYRLLRLQSDGDDGVIPRRATVWLQGPVVGLALTF